MSLFSTYVSSTCFGPHRSIIRSVLQAVFADLVCGNTRTTRHVQPSLRNGWTCQVVRTVVPHTKSTNTACKTLLMMDRRGPKHVELTYVMNKTQLLKHFVYLVGLHIYYKTIHGPYNISCSYCCRFNTYFNTQADQ